MTPKTFYSLFLVIALAPALVFAQVPQVPPATNAVTSQPGSKAQAPQRRIAQMSASNSVALPSIPALASTSSRSNLPGMRLPSSLRSATNSAPGVRPPNVFPAQTQPGAGVTPPGGLNPAASAGSGTNVISNVTTNADDGREFNLLNTPLDQVLDIYAELIGRTLLRASTGAANVDGKTPITLKTATGTTLTKNEAIMAIETVLGMNGVTVIPIDEKFAKVVNESAAPTSGGIISTNDPKKLANAGKFITQIVQLKYAAPDDVQKVLQPFTKSQSSFIIIPSTSTVVLRDYTENVKRMLEILERIDVPTPLQVKPEVIKIKYALAEDISQVLTSLGGGGGVSVGKSTSHGGFTPGFSGNSQMGGGNTGYPGSSGYSNPSLGGGMGNPMGSPATSARSSFQNNLSRVVKNAAGAGAGDFQLLGSTKIIADERTNSLLVFANDQDMITIKDIIAKLDIVLAQVLIEAIIMEVSLGDGRDLGISYLQREQQFGNTKTIGGLNNYGGVNPFGGGSASSSTSSGSTDTNSASSGTGSLLSALPSGFSYFAKFNNSLDVVLTAVQTDSRVNVLSRPRIQTSHAVPADLFIGETVPYVTGTYYGGGYNTGNSSQYTQKEVGIRLQVLPLINPEGLVVMDIQQDIEQIGQYVPIDGNQVPTTTKRQAGAKVAVHDGETIMLGGFISATRSKSHSGIPWLMNLPGIGALFRSNSDKNSRVELVVLLRPTVLPTPEVAAAVAATERDKMSGVKQAEMEIREDERQRNQEIETQLRKEAEQKAKKAKAEAAKHKNKDQAPVPAWDNAPKNPAQQTAPQDTSSQTSGSAVPASANSAPTPGSQ